MTELKLLGHKSEIPATPEDAILDVFENPHPGTLYLVRFTCPEFTSLCPRTNQPDFAHFVIDYIPNTWMIESKALKLFLCSFRNHGAFHEDCTMTIAHRLIAAMRPKWFRIGAYWYPRGGISIDCHFQTDTPPAGVWIPDQGVPTLRGRG